MPIVALTGTQASKPDASAPKVTLGLPATMKDCSTFKEFEMLCSDRLDSQMKECGLAYPKDIKYGSIKEVKRAAQASYILQDPHEVVALCKAIVEGREKLKAANLMLPIPGTTQQIKMIFDVDHLALMKVEMSKGRVYDIEGGHFMFEGKLPTAYNPDEPLRAYLGSIIEESIGCQRREAIIGHDQIGQVKKVIKTLFPRDGPLEKCIDKILEAAKNIDKSEIGDSEKIISWGKTSEGIIVQFVVHVRNGKVETCYPDVINMLKEAL